MCQLSPIEFHGDTIFCIEHEEQPYAPMRPIVENMGMDWASQSVKLNTNKERWGVVIIATPSNGGEQKMLCLPIRKLPAWFASIHPNKVRPDLREKIELYQNECDDALWNYWMNGRAERKPEPMPEIDPNASLTPDQQCTLRAIVKSRVEAIPEAERSKGIYPQIWNRFNNHFRIAKYCQLPQSRLSEAIDYLVRMELREPKELPQQQALPPSGDKYEAYMLEVEAARERMGEEISRLMDKGIALVDYHKFGPGCLSPFTHSLGDWLRDVLTQPSPIVGGWYKADRALNYSPLGIFQKMEKDFEYLKGK